MVKRAERVKLQREALGLRRNGYTYQAIADKLGVSADTAYRYVMAAYNEELEQYPEDTDFARDQDVSNLESITDMFLEGARSGDVKCAEIYLKILDRKSKYLGLDAPAKTEQKSESKVLIIDEELAGVL